MNNFIKIAVFTKNDEIIAHRVIERKSLKQSINALVDEIRSHAPEGADGFRLCDCSIESKSRHIKVRTQSGFISC